MSVIVLSKRKLKIFLAVISIFLAVCVLLSTTGAHAVFYGGETRKVPIYSVRTDEKKLAISFDCAWGVDYTDKLLEIMKAEDVKCTFFMVEFWIKKYPEYVKKIADAGHEIGTHSATHPYMSKLSEDAIRKELSTSSNAITEITGKKVEVFRPPYGDYDNLLLEVASSMGLYTIQWDVDSLDWKNLSASEISGRVLKRVKSGSIVLFHNNGLHTAEALPTVIRTLKNQGYQFVSIGELIYRENYRIQNDGTQISVI